jgi:hypothetical protein
MMGPPWAVVSPALAAGLLFMNTDCDPLVIMSKGPVHTHWLPTVAAGFLPIYTVGTPGGMIGPPTCGGVGKADMGHTCGSPTLAANPISFLF